MEFDWKADTRPFHQVIDEIRAKNPGAIQSVAEELAYLRARRTRLCCRCQCFSSYGAKTVSIARLVKFSPRIVKGLIARMTKDDAKARAFHRCTAEQEKLVRAHPDDAGALCVLVNRRRPWAKGEAFRKAGARLSWFP